MYGISHNFQFFIEALLQARDDLFNVETPGNFAPKTSAMLVSKGLFALFGQLMSMSVVQGGPAPSFLASWAQSRK